MAAIKATSTIFFAILLSGWGHFEFWQPKTPIQIFSERLQTHLESYPKDLSFSMKHYVSQDLEKTTTTFQNLVIICEYELDNPATALNIVISQTFESYKEKKCNKEKLIDIEKEDPVGFNVYWGRIQVREKKPDFAKCVDVFHATMLKRLLLLTIRYDENPLFHNIPYCARCPIATEYSDTWLLAINHFMEFAGKKTNKKMIPVEQYILENVDIYENTGVDDVQILTGEFYNEQKTEIMRHSTCIYYKAGDRTVYIYDSQGAPLEGREVAIIEKRYKGCKIETAKPSFVQNDLFSCSLYAMTYATLLLKKKDPSKYQVKLNNVHGDETLHMRLHIMEMLSKNELFLPELTKIK